MLMRRARQGLTLIELLVASALAATVAIGIATMEGSRSQMQEEVIERSGVASDQGQVALATVKMAERIERTDWAVIDNSGGTFRFRIPDGCSTPACLDVSSSYQWDQYRLSGGVLRLYTDTGAGCGTFRTLARNVTGLTFTLQPSPDINTLDYTLSWDNGLAPPKHRTHVFQGRVVSRALAAPGAELSGVAPPPPAC